MLIDWTTEFDRWLDEVEARGGPALSWATAMLADLQDLEKRPTEESATYKRVRQARRHELWRVAHPFDEQVAVRIICWFPTRRRSSWLWSASTRPDKVTSGTPALPSEARPSSISGSENTDRRCHD